MSASNDSADLEALFDSIASHARAPEAAPAEPQAAPPAPPPAAAAKDASGDSDELEALFESVAAESRESDQPADSDESSDKWSKQEVVFNRIGHMARSLHDTLGKLGYDNVLEKTAAALPDTKDRLSYIANLTEQAACRVLNATDVAVPLVTDLQERSRNLGASWEKLFANQMTTAEFRQLALDTRAFFAQELPEKSAATHAQLTEIMMAQDFQDLTGQVIKKTLAVAQELEAGLMGLLLEVVPEEKRTEEVTSLMNGPVINAAGRADVVVNQEQVDDLLESLGF